MGILINQVSMFGDGDAYNGGSQSQFGGGGFMPEKADSPAAGKGGRARSEQTILPVTLKQINDADSSDDTMKIDGKELTQVVVVGTVLSMESQALANNYSIDDGTGRIDVRWWTDAESGDVHADKRSLIREQTYVRVVGKIRNFQNQKQIVAFDVRPVKDFNEVTYHLIHCIQVHLANTTEQSPAKGAGGESSHANQAFGYGAAPSYNAPAAASNMGGGDSGLNDIQQSVMNIIEQHGTGEMGCQFGDVKSQLGARFTEQQLREAIDFLSNEGHLYSTIDEDHFKATSGDN